MTVAALLSQPPINRASIERLEAFTRQQPQVGIVTEHRFAHGLYMRKMTVPADTLITGAVHKDEHLSIMVSGDITLNTASGMERISGYHEWTAAAGTKRVGYTHAETVWITVHPTQCTTVEAVEDEIFEQPQSLLSRRLDAQLDFPKMLVEVGFDADTVRKQSENLDDQTPFANCWSVRVAPSVIEGQGLFAAFDIPANSFIAPARKSGKRTPAGRYTNHSPHPNARMQAKGSDIDLVSLKPIYAGDEILIDYRSSIRAVAESLCLE